jgi:type IV fimbrial biogenesis protein FimT
MPATYRGFTLYELLLTLLLIAVLASIGLPSFAATLARSRQSAEINALFHAFHHARKESIMRRKEVSLCPSQDGKTCTPSTDWSAGWIMYQPGSALPSGPGTSVVLSHNAGDTIRVTSNRRSFTLRATVRRSTNGTLVVCDAQNRVPPKALIISYTGRPRVAFERPDGSAWACAD